MSSLRFVLSFMRKQKLKYLLAIPTFHHRRRLLQFHHAPDRPLHGGQRFGRQAGVFALWLGRRAQSLAGHVLRARTPLAGGAGNNFGRARLGHAFTAI